MSRLKMSNGLQFQNDFIFDQNVSEKIADRNSSKMNRNWMFNLTTQVRFSKCNHHRIAIHRFQKSGPQLVIDVVENSNDLFCNIAVE